MPTTRIIITPSGRRVTLAAYVKAWKALKACDPTTIINDWSLFPCTAAEALADFSRGAEDRLNQAIPITLRGAV